MGPTTRGRADRGGDWMTPATGASESRIGCLGFASSAVPKSLLAAGADRPQHEGHIAWSVNGANRRADGI